jgi:hypothetical protein
MTAASQQEGKHSKAQSSTFDDLMQRYSTVLEENKLLRKEIESTNTEIQKFKSLST